VINAPNICIVIPTRNRLDSLNRTLNSIGNQTFIPKEIIIVDSSDLPIEKKQLTSNFSNCDLQIIHTKPSVCLQRNIGIKKSGFQFVFLCDDDLVFDENYIETLFHYMNANPSIQMVSGLVLEKDASGWSFGHEISNLNLAYKLFFGLSIFSDLSLKENSNPFLKCLVKKSLTKGNRISRAGWPHFVDMSKDEISFPFFSLMATLIRKPDYDLFDQAFVYNGIGDNYDACIKLGFNITILKKIKAYHHRENINRIDSVKGFFYRTSALHYIIKKYPMFNWKNKLYLIWSLIGVLIPNVIKVRFKNIQLILILIIRIIVNQNIYDKTNLK
jgi:glycosyltransferase involved in cell wall biosynthesis